jgi:hypothetical protein
MEDANLIEIVRTYSKVNLLAILNDMEFNAKTVENYVVWEERLNKNRSDAKWSDWWSTLPDTVILRIAINENGTFYIGAIGPDADVLSVLTDGGISTPAVWGYPIPKGRELTDPWLKIDDRSNILAKVAEYYITKLKEKGYMDLGPKLVYSIYGADYGKALLDLDRLEFKLLNMFDKPITILATAIFMCHADSEYCCGFIFNHALYSEAPNWPIKDARHHNWNPRPNDTFKGESHRRLTLSYEGVEASFVSSRADGDNGNSGYVKFDGNEITSFKDYDLAANAYRNADIYPQEIELCIESHWSENHAFFKIAILGGEIICSDESEEYKPTSSNNLPSMDGNPAPFIVEIPPTTDICPFIDNPSPCTFTTTPVSLSLFGNASINEQPIEPGDIIFVFASGIMINNGCIGYAQVTESGKYSVTIFGDDPNTSKKDGANQGDPLNFKAYDKSEEVIIDLYPQGSNVVEWPNPNISSMNINLNYEYRIPFKNVINLGLVDKWKFGSMNCLGIIQKNYVYCGTELGLLIIDIGDPHIPKEVTFMRIGGVYDIASTDPNHYVILANGNRGLSLFDINISGPEKPAYVGTFDTYGDSRSISIVDDYAYIADACKGLLIINISNPKRPKHTGSFRNLVAPEGIFVSDNYAYLADGYEGLVIIDISDPFKPEYVSRFDTPGYALGVNISDNKAYVADGRIGGLIIIDISDPSNLKCVGEFNKANNYNFNSRKLAIKDNFAFVVDSTGLAVIDISDPNMPKYGGRFTTSGSSEDIVISGDYAYVADGEGGLVIFDIKDPVGPEYLSTFSNNLEDTYDVTVSGNYAYVVDRSMMFKLTDQSLEELKVEGMPENIVDQLQELKNNVYSYGDFIDKLKNIIGEENTETYKSLFLDHAYCDNGLVIVDVSNSALPQFTGKYNYPSYYIYYFNYYGVKISDINYYDVKVSGNYAYMTVCNPSNDYNGILSVNITEKTNPQYADFNDYNFIDEFGSVIDIGSKPLSIDLNNNYAYIGDFNYGFLVFNISNPSYLKYITDYRLSGIENLFTTDNYAYLAAGKKGLVIIDISNPADPKYTGGFDTSDAAMNLYKSGNHVYMADGDDGLIIFNVSDPNNPVYTGRCDTPHYADDVVIDGNFAYVADWFNGFVVINISDPSNPKYVGGYDILKKSRGIDLYDNHVYIADSEVGLVIFDINDPVGIEYLSELNVSGYTKNVVIKGDYAYLADGRGGLKILYISDPTGPKYISRFDTYGFTLDLDLAGNYTYLADDRNGLIVVDIINPNAPNPKFVGQLNFPGAALAVVVEDNHAYVANGDYGILIVDISNPNKLEIKSKLDTSGFSLDLDIDGNYAYIADYNNGLVMIDITNPNTPNFIGKFYIPGGARNVDISGNYAYVVDGDGGLVIVDISVPASLKYVARHQIQGSLLSVNVSGEYAYIVCGETGLTVIDISDPNNITYAGRYDSEGYAQGLYVSGDNVYLADGSNGLLEIEADFEPSLKGNLILVAGGAADSENPIWPATQTLANYVFKIFIASGYQIYDIWYQNPVYSQDIDNNGFYDQFIVDDSTPTKAEFQKSITDWAAKAPNTGPLYIYLIGHGAEDRFQIMPGQVITAAELKDCIDKFQKSTDRQVVVIVESAASGTFIDNLINDPNSDNITVITSTGDGASYIKPLFILLSY